MDGSCNAFFTTFLIQPAFLFSFPSFSVCSTGCGPSDDGPDLDSLIASYILFGRFLFREPTTALALGGGGGVTTAAAAAPLRPLTTAVLYDDHFAYHYHQMEHRHEDEVLLHQSMEKI